MPSLPHQVLLSDFFLCNCADEFMEAARHFIFETYCRIHHKIDIGMLADKMVCSGKRLVANVLSRKSLRQDLPVLVAVSVL